MASSNQIPEIRPISELRTNLNEIVKLAKSTEEPIYMTKNGTPELVVMSCDAFEKQRLFDRYVAKLREAEIESNYMENPISERVVEARMKELFKYWGV